MYKISSFTALNVTQTLVTLIDSIFRLIVVFALIDLLGTDQSNKILSISGALFVIPFLVFSMPAGQLADRFSKRKVIIWTLWAELFFMIIGLFSMYAQGVFSTYFSLFLIALQASVFSPAKYAILPEIVSKEKISSANGHMTLCTYAAVILGTFLASFIADITGRNYFVVTLVCVFMSAIALIFSYFIEETPAQDPERKINYLFLLDVYKSLKEASHYPHLLLVSIATAFFLFTASYTQLNMLPFGIESLNISDIQSGYVYLSAALGIGLGSLIVAKFSGKGVKLGIAVFGAFGTAVSYLLLYIFETQLIPVVFFVMLVGINGGLYIVPLDAYLQITSPEKSRGSIIAAATFLGVFAVLLAAGFLSLIGDVFRLPASMGFFLVGFITLVFSFYLCFRLFNITDLKEVKKQELN